MQKLFISVLWFFNILAALALLIAYLAPFIDPSLISFPAFFGLAFPLLLFLNIAFVIVWLFVKWKYAFLSLFLLVAGYSHIKPHVQIFPEKEEQNVDGIKVMTYNVRNYAQQGKKHLKATIDSVKRILETQNPDIICLQEATKKNRISLKGYQVIGQIDNYILTRLKVVNTSYLLDETDFKFGVYADVIFEGDTIRVYNVQLLSYSVSKDIEEYENDPDKVTPKKRFITIAQKLKNGFEARVTETYRLRKSLERSPYPVILCGYLNDTPVSYTYREIMSAGLKDAFTESGSGYGNTYNGYLPKIRIDYIFASDQFEIYNYKVLKTHLSDHFPVTAFIVPGENE